MVLWSSSTLLFLRLTEGSLTDSLVPLLTVELFGLNGTFISKDCIGHLYPLTSKAGDISPSWLTTAELELLVSSARGLGSQRSSSIGLLWRFKSRSLLAAASWAIPSGQ